MKVECELYFMAGLQAAGLQTWVNPGGRRKEREKGNENEVIK
jgi:hypothetical protein